MLKERAAVVSIAMLELAVVMRARLDSPVCPAVVIY
jgi:hypothetical protein